MNEKNTVAEDFEKFKEELIKRGGKQNKDHNDEMASLVRIG